MPDPLTPRIWLRTRRAELDVLQSEAALAVGVSRATWSRWSSGDAAPTLEQAVALARWSGRDLDDVARAFGLGEIEVELETVAEQADRLTDCSP